MKQGARTLHQIWEKILAIVGALFVLLPTSPMNVQFPGRDSGVFLYAGWRILNGELPYRDVWDHKPPVIFYINALGLAIANGSRWGVWLLEFVSLSLAAFFGFVLVRRALGAAPALLSTVLWLLTLVFVLEGGNLTTEYTLPLQFVTLWLASRAIERPGLIPWHWLLIGLTGGIAFFTKQTTIGIWLSIVVFLIVWRVKFRETKRMVAELALACAGALSVCMAWGVYFFLRKGLVEFIDGAFVFNFAYVQVTSGLLERLRPVVVGIQPLAETGLLQLAGIGYVVGVFVVYWKRDAVRNWLPLLAIALVDLPVELMLVSASGKTYAHYYMAVLPVLAVLAGVALWAILSARVLGEMPRTARRLLSVGFAAALLWASAGEYVRRSLWFGRENWKLGVVKLVEARTNPGESVLLWGAESGVNFFARRESPTRFVYQYPLYIRGYTNEGRILEFLDGVIRRRPQVIVDTRNPRAPMYKFPVESYAIRERLRYLQGQYRAVGRVGEEEWVVYERLDPASGSFGGGEQTAVGGGRR